MPADRLPACNRSAGIKRNLYSSNLIYGLLMVESLILQPIQVMEILLLGSKQEQFEILTQSLTLHQQSRTSPTMTHASLVVHILQHTTIIS